MFSTQSVSRLSTCHPDLRVLFYEVIRFVDCTILEGYRDQAAQEDAFKRKATKLHYPHGKHNRTPSVAVDVAPYPIPSMTDPKKLGNFYYFGGFVSGIAAKLLDEGKMTHRIRYGGDWNMNRDVTDETFIDAVHFELIGA